MALAEANLPGASVAALGIASQRENTQLWERRSGRPVGRAIVWQDRRIAALCARPRTQAVRSRSAGRLESRRIGMETESRIGPRPAGKQISPDDQQVVDECLPARGRNVREIILAHLGAQRFQAGKRAPGLRPHVQTVGAPVAGIVAAVNPAGGMEAVDMPADGCRLEPEHPRHVALAAAGVARHLAEDEPLGAAEAQFRLFDAPVELPAQQMADVVQ